MPLLRKKKASLLSTLDCMLRCRDKQVVPTWVKVKHRIDTLASRRIQHANLALIPERVHYTRRELGTNATALLETHLKCTMELTKTGLDMADGADSTTSGNTDEIIHETKGRI
jgi:hypothetical protein